MRLLVQADLRFAAIERPQQIQIGLAQSIKGRRLTPVSRAGRNPRSAFLILGSAIIGLSENQNLAYSSP